MRYILNSISKLTCFFMLNIFLPILVFVALMILENSLLVQTNSTMFHIDFSNLKNGQILLNLNTSFCDIMIFAVVICVNILACLKRNSDLCAKKNNGSYINKKICFACEEAKIIESTFNAGVNYLRI